MLRDIMTRLPGYGTWPCDEINYIWRHGNTRHPDDEFGRELATPAVKRFIRRAFARIARAQRVHTVVEKTCANSLRVGFVHEILPEARFIFLLRDGRDVVASSIRRWRAPLDVSYLYRKARYVPASDLPFYTLRYLGNRVFKLVSGKRRLASWGPRFEGMKECLGSSSLAEVCALQWKRCVEKAEQEFERIDRARVHRIRYEDFVGDPPGELRTLARFLDLKLSAAQAERLTAQVADTSVDKWRTELDGKTVEQLKPLLDSTLKRYGYG